MMLALMLHLAARESEHRPRHGCFCNLNFAPTPWRRCSWPEMQHGISRR